MVEAEEYWLDAADDVVEYFVILSSYKIKIRDFEKVENFNVKIYCGIILKLFVIRLLLVSISLYLLNKLPLWHQPARNVLVIVFF